MFGREVATAWPRAYRAGVPVPQGANEHRNPAKRDLSEQPWALWFRHLPDHPSIQRRLFNGKDSEEDDFVLKVGRPTFTQSSAAALADRRVAGGRLGGPGRRRPAHRDEGECGLRAHPLRFEPAAWRLTSAAGPAPRLGRDRAPRARGDEDVRAALRAVTAGSSARPRTSSWCSATAS